MIPLTIIFDMIRSLEYEKLLDDESERRALFDECIGNELGEILVIPKDRKELSYENKELLWAPESISELIEDIERGLI